MQSLCELCLILGPFWLIKANPVYLIDLAWEKPPVANGNFMTLGYHNHSKYMLVVKSPNFDPSDHGEAMMVINVKISCKLLFSAVIILNGE